MSDIEYLRIVQYLKILDNYLCKDVINLVKGYLICRTVNPVNLFWFETPFYFIEQQKEYKDEYIYNDDLFPIWMKVGSQYASKFYENIKTIFYLYYNNQDDGIWKLVGKLNNNKYFYYAASCIGTGFGYKGWMELNLTNELDDLIRLLDNNTRRDYRNYQSGRDMEDESDSE